MDILFLLVPLSVLLALAVMGVLAWAVWSGQFEALDGESERILATTPINSLQPAPPVSTSLIHINTRNSDEQHTQGSVHVNFQAKRISHHDSRIEYSGRY